MLKEQNKLNQAEALYRRALKGREEIYGSSHRDTLYTKGHLGHCLMLQSNSSGNDMIVDAFHKLKEGPNGITSSHPWYKKFTKILKNPNSNFSKKNVEIKRNYNELDCIVFKIMMLGRLLSYTN